MENEQQLYVVRRLDDLGRIVIPKSVRKLFGLEAGDMLKVLVEDDAIVLRKHHALEGVESFVSYMLNSIFESTGWSAAVISEGHVLYRSCSMEWDTLPPHVVREKIYCPFGSILAELMIFSNESFEGNDASLLCSFVARAISNMIEA